MKKFLSKAKSGFTLLEVLLVVAIIAILAGIVIVALNPGKQLGDTRNSQRRADVNTILSAVYQYSIDNNGNLPKEADGITDVIPTGTCGTAITGGSTTEICKQGTIHATCATDNLVDLSKISENQTYLTAIPIDPSGVATDHNGNGYFIAKSANGRVTVCAPNREPNTLPMITVTK